jgi:hypothetical protein
VRRSWSACRPLPEFRAGTEVARQAQGRIGRDAASLASHVVDARRRQAQRDRQRIGRKIQRQKKFLAQHLAWMNRPHAVANLAHFSPSSVIHDLDIECLSVTPNETHAPRVVDPYAPLARAVALQRLQPISGRHTQIRQTRCDVQLPELSQCNALDEHPPENPLATGQCRGVGIPERPDHDIE